MKWDILAEALFGANHGIVLDGDFLHGTAYLDERPLAVV
ncbi:MAG: Biotin-independent malonate decarboxylase subunit gamma [Variovorax sp.]|nr:Biotin-independent malonate decarboxylase subunit gamma [Variovorax sp.]